MGLSCGPAEMTRSSLMRDHVFKHKMEHGEMSLWLRGHIALAEDFSSRGWRSSSGLRIVLMHQMCPLYCQDPNTIPTLCLQLNSSHFTQLPSADGFRGTTGPRTHAVEMLVQRIPRRAEHEQSPSCLFPGLLGASTPPFCQD